MRLVLTPQVWAGDGQPVGFLLISKDVVDEVLLTQHKKLDQQLPRARRLTTVALSRPG